MQAVPHTVCVPHFPKKQPGATRSTGNDNKPGAAAAVPSQRQTDFGMQKRRVSLQNSLHHSAMHSPPPWGSEKGVVLASYLTAVLALRDALPLASRPG